MNDYLGHLAQRASTPVRQVMPRVGTLFEPMPGTRVPTMFERDESIEGGQEPTSPRSKEMDGRHKEHPARLNEPSVPPEFVADPRPDAHRGLQPFTTVRTLANVLPARLDTPAHQVPSPAGVVSPRIALDDSHVRAGPREPDTFQQSTETRASRDGHPEPTKRSVGIRPAVAAMDRSRAEKLPRTVRIEIGRIEIRATSSPTRPHIQRPVERPRQSLEEYLQHRSGPTR